MIKFYRRSAIGLVALLGFTTVILCGSIVQSEVNAPLYPESDDALRWQSEIEPLPGVNGSQLTVKRENEAIEYDFFLDPTVTFPYTHYSFEFIEPGQEHSVVDLTDYDRISFRILCDPKNVLLLVLFSFDDKVTNPLQSDTRRVSSTAFTCRNNWNAITLNLDDLVTPSWWLDQYGFELSDRGYNLSQTMGFALVNTHQSPTGVLSNVRLTDVTLSGRQPIYLYGAILFCALLWIAFGVWIMRQYALALSVKLKEKLRQDQPLIAYKRLSIEPQRDNRTSALLRYMATEYANSELNLDSAATTLGINRTKINEILKEELGLTFTAYLKKLRLTETARLLAEDPDATISQIAYSVGYNNVSYFNKVFKAEYGCTPKTFQSVYQSKSENVDPPMAT